MAPSQARSRRIVIIGSGFSGIGLGIQLKRAGIESFTILEKGERVGGTWRDNTYPGAACDTPAFSYCFSFEQKTDWSRKWSPQSEILGYLEHCTEKYGLRPHIRFGTEVAGARFDADACLWRIRTRSGEEIEAEVLVSSVGQLNRPSIPDVPGLDRFRGPCFHSARWEHGVELEGRRVAVIGNAASAIQFVPQIAPRVKQLTIFQRSPNWMLPRGDRAYSEAEKRRYGRFPWLARLYRWRIWLGHDVWYPVFRGNAFLSRRFAGLAEKSMRAQVRDPALQEKLVPDYPIGGKRILISDDYYATLNRENVELVTEPIDHLREDAVVTRDGGVHPADVVILGTGFHSTEFLAPMEIEGLEGRSLATEWKDGARAYLGLSLSGFPNFFMTYGPNTNLGHNSIIFMLECQFGYIVQCVKRLAEADLGYLDLRQDVLEAYNAELQRELAGTAWAATDRSWYKNAAGRITNNWSGTTTRYWWRTRKVDFDRYRQAARPAAVGAVEQAPRTAASAG